jgi:hypothetical protein
MMRLLMLCKCFIGLILFSAMACSINAQSTTVSATVVDGSGQVWNNGTITVTFLPNPQYPSANYNINGTSISSSWKTGISYVLDSSGSVTISGVPTSTAITPSGSSWSYTVCPNATFNCSVINIPTIGATQNISSTLTAALSLISLSGTPLPKAYADSEIKTVQTQGSTYYNTGTTTPGPRFWDGSNWNAVLNGASILANAIVQPNTTNNTLGPTAAYNAGYFDLTHYDTAVQGYSGNFNWRSLVGLPGTTAGGVFGVEIPTTAPSTTATFSAGLFAIANNKATNSLYEGLGAYIEGLATGNNSHATGANIIGVARGNTTNVQGVEIDMDNQSGTNNSLIAMSVSGDSWDTDPAFSTVVQVYQPQTSAGVPKQWGSIIRVDDGASNEFALIGTKNPNTASSDSQEIDFKSRATAGIGFDSESIYGSSAGDIVLIPKTGRYVQAPAVQFPDGGFALDNTSFSSWFQSTPTVTCQTGSGYTVTSTLRRNVIGKNATFTIGITLTTLGTCGGQIIVTMPFTSNFYGNATCVVPTTGIGGNGVMLSGGTSLYISKYDGTTLASASGIVIACSGVIETT